MTLYGLNLSHWITQCLSMSLVALFIPNLRVTSIFGPVFAVVGLSLVNTYLWSSELFSVLPSSVSAQTATILLINGAIFWLVVKVMPGIETKGIIPSLVAPIVFTACSLVLPKVTDSIDWVAVWQKGEQLLTLAKVFVSSKQ